MANEIEVRLPASSERTDADLAAAAIRALEWDAFIPNNRVKVTVSKGWVTLEGEVDWLFERDDAERVVRRLTGVRGVTNLIKVKSHVTSTELKRKIENALVRSAQTDAQHITVEVHGSQVVLKGTGPRNARPSAPPAQPPALRPSKTTSSSRRKLPRHRRGRAPKCVGAGTPP